MNEEKKLFGWFDSAEQTKPSYNPPTICLFCTNKIIPPQVKTISLLADKGNKAYFYRVHKDCYEKASQDEICLYESSILDNSLKNNQQTND